MHINDQWHNDLLRILSADHELSLKFGIFIAWGEWMNPHLHSATAFRVLFRNLKQRGVGTHSCSGTVSIQSKENSSAANVGENGQPKWRALITLQWKTSYRRVKQKGGDPRIPPFPFCEVNDGPGQIRESFGGYATMKWDVNTYKC